MDLALFDLDETLIGADSSGLWLRWLESRGQVSAELRRRERQLMEQYYRGEMAIEDYMRLILSPLAGRHRDTVAQWAESFIDSDILPQFYPAARERMAWHRQRGDCIVVVSASGEHLVAPIARRLGADHSLAIGVALENERYTGDIYGVPTYQQGKVTRIEQWLAEHNGAPFRARYGYSDSINDRTLLEYVDHPFVINPDPALEALAAQRNWPINRWQV